MFSKLSHMLLAVRSPRTQCPPYQMILVYYIKSQIKEINLMILFKIHHVEEKKATSQLSTYRTFMLKVFIHQM